MRKIGKAKLVKNYTCHSGYKEVCPGCHLPLTNRVDILMTDSKYRNHECVPLELLCIRKRSAHLSLAFNSYYQRP